MTKHLRSRTWPVFVIGFGSLLALLFLPGIVALRQTRSVYGEIQQIQESHQRTLKLLSEIERRVYMISITVREALLDSSASSGDRYKNVVAAQKEEIEHQLDALGQTD